MHYLVVNRNEHVIWDTPLARHIKRVTGDPAYFTIWHLKEQRWVVARWVNYDRGWITESGFAPKHTNLGLVPRGLIDQIEFQRSDLATSWAKEKCSEMKTVHRASLLAMQEKADTHLAMKRFLQKRSRLKQDHPDWVTV